MKPLHRLGVVLAGYALALLAGCVATEIRVQHTQGPDAQASAGMYMFGDGLLFLAVFGLVALVPTGLGLWFLRRVRSFWNALTVAVAAVAATGALSAIVLVVARHGRSGGALEVLAAIAVLRVLLAPGLAGAFTLAGVFAPGGTSRRALFACAVVEGGVALSMASEFFAASGFKW